MHGSVLVDEQLLNEAVRRLVESLHPDRIYLFGSRARGDAEPDSDYDLMVIVPEDEPTARFARERLAYRILGDLGIAKDVLVRTRSEFERDRPVVASLAATVAREGRLLYGSPSAVEDEAVSAEADTRRADLTRQWLAKAGMDLAAAKRSLDVEPKLPEIAMYHCQQAFEKALKGFLTWRDQPLRKTHELTELVDQCERIDAAFADLHESAAEVSPYATRFRYPNDDPSGVPLAPGQDEAESALQVAGEAVEFVHARLPAAARP